MLRPEDCIPGTLVECIDAKTERRRALLIEGRIYTIASVLEDYPKPEIQEVCPFVFVAGMPDEPWARHRFRLLPDERLSIFRKMLAPAPKQKERV